MIVFRLRALTLQPRVQLRGRRLTATTSGLLTWLALGAYALRVHVDGDAQYVHVHKRSFWFFTHSRVVPFKQILRIRYGYDGLPTSWDSFGNIHDEVERFRVSLELHSSEQVHLGSFVGEGAAGSFTTLLTGDSLVDLAGTQDLDSRRFVEQLCAITGATLSGPPKRVTDADGRQWFCDACGRAVAPRPKCLYCGGQARARQRSLPPSP